MITISPEASEYIKDIMKEYPGYVLRLGIKGGSCSDELLVGLDKADSTDEMFYPNDIPIAIRKTHYLHVFGAFIDISPEKNLVVQIP